MNFQVETLGCLHADACEQRIYADTSKIMKEGIWRSL